MKILDNPNYMILKDGEDYIFYNSNRHFACRISELDLSIFNLIYLYESFEKVVQTIPAKYHKYIKNVYDAVVNNQILSEKPILNYNDIERLPPHSYYLHLTYKCNLDCIYCYNKKVRNNFSELSIEKWKIMLDKILPYAKKIIITGGEPFLTDLLPKVIRYIREYGNSIHIEIISNCMTDFEHYQYREDVFNQINSVIFSCDNLTGEGQQRVNFKPALFKHNIQFLKEKYSKLNITISSVHSSGNCCELEYIRDFCSNKVVDFRSVLIVPNSTEDISLLPSIEDFISTLPSVPKNLEELRFYCGAGVGLFSIDPAGNVFPCQSLHIEDYKMGNILHDSIEDILKNNISEALRTGFCVDNIPTCKECNVKYICAAGCRAATLNTEQSPTAFPHTLCEYYKAKAHNSLRSIPQLTTINLYQ